MQRKTRPSSFLCSVSALLSVGGFLCGYVLYFFNKLFDLFYFWWLWVVALFCFFLISTHAPLAGRDRLLAGGEFNVQYFNSHAPCGARHVLRLHPQDVRNFNSHAPCGARHSVPCRLSSSLYFNSHAPCGARHGVAMYSLCGMPISTHTPLAGRDWRRFGFL